MNSDIKYNIFIICYSWSSLTYQIRRLWLLVSYNLLCVVETSLFIITKINTMNSSVTQWWSESCEMMIRLFLWTALLCTASSEWWYPTPSPYTNDSIMSGHFRYKRVPGDAKVWEEYMKVWGVKMPEQNQIDDQGRGKNVSYGAYNDDSKFKFLENENI